MPTNKETTRPVYSANVSSSTPSLPSSRSDIDSSQNPYAYAEQFFGDSQTGIGHFDSGLYMPSSEDHSQPDYNPDLKVRTTLLLCMCTRVDQCPRNNTTMARPREAGTNLAIREASCRPSCDRSICASVICIG